MRAQGIDLTQGGPIQITAQDGIDWRQAEQVIIKGDAKAVNGNAPSRQTGSRRCGRRRRGRATGDHGLAGATGTEGNESIGCAPRNVHIYTQTDGRGAIRRPRSGSVGAGDDRPWPEADDPERYATARDVEYWSAKHMAWLAATRSLTNVRGAFRLIRWLPIRSLRQPHCGTDAIGDCTVASRGPIHEHGRSTAVMAGRLEKVEAFGECRSHADRYRDRDRGIYVRTPGSLIWAGMSGLPTGKPAQRREAVVNMKTGVATLLSGDSGRVSGLVVPNVRQTRAGRRHRKSVAGRSSEGRPARTRSNQ